MYMYVRTKMEIHFTGGVKLLIDTALKHIGLYPYGILNGQRSFKSRVL